MSIDPVIFVLQAHIVLALLRQCSVLERFWLNVNLHVYRKNKALVKDLSVPNPNFKDLWFPTQYSQPFWAQFTSCLWKQHLTYWRSPDYNNIRYLFTLMAALLFGTIFWGLGKKRQVYTCAMPPSSRSSPFSSTAETCPSIMLQGNRWNVQRGTREFLPWWMSTFCSDFSAPVISTGMRKAQSPVLWEHYLVPLSLSEWITPPPSCPS